MKRKMHQLIDIYVKLAKKKPWSDKPQGWTNKSVNKYTKTLTEDSDHPFTECMKKIKDTDIKSPEAFCGSVKSRVNKSKKKASLVSFSKELEFDWNQTVNTLRTMPDQPWFAEPIADSLTEIGKINDFLDIADVDSEEDLINISDQYETAKEISQSLITDLISNKDNIDESIYNLIISTIQVLGNDISNAYREIMKEFGITTNYNTVFQDFAEQADQKALDLEGGAKSYNIENILEWQKYQPHKLREYQKKYYNKEKDKILKQKKEYYEKNIEKEKKQKAERARAKRKQNKINKELEQLNQLKALLSK